jgi:hypothetical protein
MIHPQEASLVHVQVDAKSSIWFSSGTLYFSPTQQSCKAF